MKQLLAFLLLACLIPGTALFSQSKTAANLTEAYRFESNNSPLFSSYAEQAEKEGMPEVANFFRAISKTASIHADNFQKVLSAMGVTVTPTQPVIIVKTSKLNIEDALKSVRIEAGIKYAEYLEQAKTDSEKGAVKELRWAKETEQQSLQLFVNVADALANENMNSLPTFYWVCPKCGNLYDVADQENECSYCFTEKEKFLKIQ